MKIMRPESRSRRCARRRTHTRMRRGIVRFPRGQPAPCHFNPKGDQHMQWQTPQATDIRLGFEITMYVAAR